MAGQGTGRKNDPQQANRIKKLQEDLNDLCGGNAVFKTSPACPAGVQETDLEDILAFESVGKGISLFEGLQKHGVDLPHPDGLDEMESRRKAMEVLKALADLRIFLTGMDGMSGRTLYRTLWKRTLWEGCYVRKRHPGAITMIDVSHKTIRSKMRRFLDGLIMKETIH